MDRLARKAPGASREDLNERHMHPYRISNVLLPHARIEFLHLRTQLNSSAWLLSYICLHLSNEVIQIETFRSLSEEMQITRQCRLEQRMKQKIVVCRNDMQRAT